MPKIFCNDDNLEMRFWAKVDKRSDDRCWNWTAAKTHGYGSIGTSRGLERAHRVSYRLHFGDFDKSLSVCHTCDNPGCVNPSHLFLGSHLDNMLDKERKGRANQPIGARNHATKITESDVIEIRNDSRPCADIARQYGIDPSNVKHIKKRRTWKHVI